jgi:Tfp pilus assembly protein PilF
MNLGGVLGSQGRFKAADDQFRTALKIDPTLAQAHARLAQASLKVDDPAVAVTHFQTAIEYNQRDIASCLDLVDTSGRRHSRRSTSGCVGPAS